MDYGTVTVTVNGVPATVDYGEHDTNTGLAPTLAADLNAGNLVSALASSNVIYLTAKQSGASTNYSLSGSSQSTNPDFGVASFSATPPVPRSPAAPTSTTPTT